MPWPAEVALALGEVPTALARHEAAGRRWPGYTSLAARLLPRSLLGAVTALPCCCYPVGLL